MKTFAVTFVLDRLDARRRTRERRVGGTRKRERELREKEKEGKQKNWVLDDRELGKEKSYCHGALMKHEGTGD